MPNAKVLSEKQAIVEALSERVKNANCGVIVNYEGINVADDTQLRRELSQEGIEYTVVKNTLLRFALDKCELSGMDSVLHGTTAMATTVGDPIAPIRILTETAKKLNKNFAVKSAFMYGSVLSEGEIADLSKLTSVADLYSKLAGSLNAILGGLAVALGEVVEQKGGSIEAPAAE